MALGNRKHPKQCGNVLLPGKVKPKKFSKTATNTVMRPGGTEKEWGGDLHQLSGD